MPAFDLSVLPLHLMLPLASGVVYVGAALFLKRASEEGADVWGTTRVCNWITAVLFAPLWLLGGRIPDVTIWWQPALVALMFLLGQVFTMLALRVGDVSVATPVLGLKILLVALLTSLMVGERLTGGLWAAAALGSVGVALLQFSRPRSAGHVGRTICLAGLAAGSYAVFDVLVQKWSPAWGAGRFLPIMMACGAIWSFALPFGGGRSETRGKANRWLLLGAGCLALQALMLVSSIALYQHATVANVLYSSRGLWSVLIVWLAGRRLGSQESAQAPGTFAWRLIGALTLTAAIVVVAFMR